MKNLSRCSLVIGTLLFCSLCTMVSAQQNQTQPNGNSPTSQSLRIGIVNTKALLGRIKIRQARTSEF